MVLHQVNSYHLEREWSHLNWEEFRCIVSFFISPSFHLLLSLSLSLSHSSFFDKHGANCHQGLNLFYRLSVGFFFLTQTIPPSFHLWFLFIVKTRGGRDRKRQIKRRKTKRDKERETKRDRETYSGNANSVFLLSFMPE